MAKRLKLPKPASEKAVESLKRERISGEFNPARVYIDEQGVKHPWVDDRNPAMWREL